jgi:hypothetical protein
MSLWRLCAGALKIILRCFRGFFMGFEFCISFFTYTIVLAALAILGHLSAASRATGPRISEPFISPSGVMMTAAFSSN